MGSNSHNDTITTNKGTHSPLCGSLFDSAWFYSPFSVRCFFLPTFGRAQKKQSLCKPCRTIAIQMKRELILNNRKIIFTYTTLGAFPIVGNVVEGRAGGNTAVGVTNFWIINPATYIADIFFHIMLLS